ncbi:redoxin domain-containing protein [Halovenus marina]|uniref:redoxin domain-containing protein n=1 Tax=Halovenus marina TaxID=3396621 RepID=UPI003F550268
MVREGDTAPDFTAPLANGDVDSFTLSDALDDGPVVLAFFPGAFTSVCSHEMNALQDRLDSLTDSAQVYGVSVDSPFSLDEFRDKLGLEFALISDTNRNIVHEYDLAMDFTELGVHNVAKRSVLVIDEDGTVSYAWVSDDPGVEPSYDELEAAVANV